MLFKNQPNISSETEDNLDVLLLQARISILKLIKKLVPVDVDSKSNEEKLANLIKTCRAYREIVARPQGPADDSEGNLKPAPFLIPAIDQSQTTKSLSSGSK